MDLFKYIKKFNYIICEDIKIDIKNKNILLIDELLNTGNTVNFISNYLLNKKLANSITISCICITNNNNNNNIIYSMDKFYIFWPWGMLLVT